MIERHTIVPGKELRGQGSDDGSTVPTTPETYPNGEIGGDAKPLKRAGGPPHGSKQSRIGGLEPKASFPRREEAKKVREGAVARSKYRSSRTCSVPDRRLCARRQHGNSSPPAILGREYEGRECGYAGREASPQARDVELLHLMEAWRTVLQFSSKVEKLGTGRE